VRCPVLRSGVGLDLDDARFAMTRLVDADQASAEQDAGDLGRSAAEEGPIQDGQAVLPG
jgi:hypothetical protein